MMRTVFMGTPEFAVPVLRALEKFTQVQAVYTREDAISKRGKTPTPSPVKTAALELGLPVYTPATLRDEAVIEQLKAIAPEVIIVAAYGMILPKEILEIAPLGCINLHASLLPRYRGAAPIQRAILAGETHTGVAVMQMEEGLDTGPYSLVEKVEIAEKNTLQLTKDLSEAAALLIEDALPKLQQGNLTWTVQDESLATHAPKITKDEVGLHPELSATEFSRRVRASSPSAPARLTLANHGVTVLESSIVAPSTDASFDSGAEGVQKNSDLSLSIPSPGAVLVTKHQVILGVKDGAVILGTIKPDGKQAMSARDFVRGARIDSGNTWE